MARRWVFWPQKARAEIGLPAPDERVFRPGDVLVEGEIPVGLVDHVLRHYPGLPGQPSLVEVRSDRAARATAAMAARAAQSRQPRIVPAELPVIAGGQVVTVYRGGLPR